MRKVSEKKLKKELEIAKKYYGDGFFDYVTDSKTGRPLFMYRHPNFPLAISIISLILVVCKPVLLGMLQWLQTVLSK